MTSHLRGWLFLCGAILTEVSGSLSLRGALDEPWLYVIVVVGFLAAFTFLSAALRQGLPLGVAYGVWGATGVALTAVMSMVLFDEPLTALMGVGIVAIIAGVLCIELGAQAAHARPDEVRSATGESHLSNARARSNQKETHR